MKKFCCWILLGLLVACGGPKKEEKLAEKDSEKKEEKVPVEVAQVGTGFIEATLSASANLETEAQVAVYSRTSNLLKTLLVEEGDRVSKGDVLARLDDESQKIAREKAQATFEKNEKEYLRQKALFEQKMISQQVFNDTVFAYDQSKLDLRDAELMLAYTEITAPIDGTVTARLVNLGDQVNVNQHLFDIVDFDSMVVRVYLPEKNLPQLKVGQKARIRSQAMGQREFSGSILRIAPTVDPRTGTVKVTVKVQSENVLRPGMYVDVSIILKTIEDATLVPKRALVFENEQTYVYRLKDDDTVERLAITPILADTLNIQPDAHIQPGDTIVVAGQTGLKNGAAVQILQTEAPALAGQSE